MLSSVQRKCISNSHEAYLPYLEFLLDQKLDWKSRSGRLN